MKNLTENVWLLNYKLPLLGEYLGRNVTILRLASGDLLIHSTAPFTLEDVAAINAVGKPAYLVDALSKHDTFAKEGHNAFPEVPYYAPEGFSESTGVPTQPLSDPPAAWQGEVEVLKLAGKKDVEYVMLHRPSGTLIVTDLVLDIGEHAPTTTKLIAPILLTGAEPQGVGMSRPEKFSVADKAAFQQSLDTILSWDFDRLIVGHGEVVESGGKERLRQALRGAGF